MRLIVSFVFLFLTYISSAQTFEMYKGDTINFADEDGIKSGKWIYFDNEKNPISEGIYEFGLKSGIWKEYYSSRKLKSEITYKNGKKNGKARSFYENGQIKEEGTWEQNKWTGAYKYWHENGNLFYLWNYNTSGERTGEQKYFHENGKINIEGQWQNGKENGIIKEYAENGALVAENNFNEGVFNAETSKIYNVQQVQEKNNPDNAVSTKETNQGTNNNSSGVFTGTGYKKFYTKTKQIEQDGYFLNGYLWTGKKYIYDQNDKLIKTLIYEKGKITETLSAD